MAKLCIQSPADPWPLPQTDSPPPPPKDVQEKLFTCPGGAGKESQMAHLVPSNAEAQFGGPAQKQLSFSEVAPMYTA